MSIKSNNNQREENKFEFREEFIFNNDMIGRLLYPKFNFPKHIFYHCGDNECSNICGIPNRYFSINKYTRKPINYLHSFKQDKDINERVVLFDYWEKDVVFGAYNKIRDYLDHFDKHCNNYNFTFRCQCIPLLIGEDFESLVQHFNNKGNNKYFFSKMSLDASDYFAMETVKKVINNFKSEKVNNKQKKNRKLSVSIFAENDHGFIKEMKFILQLFDIEVAGIYLPNLVNIEKVKNSDLCVFINNEYYREIYNYIISQFNKKSIILNAPYGITETTNFYKKIVLSLGLNFSNKKFGSLINKYLKKQEQLKLVDDKYTITLIINKDEIDIFCDTAKFFNSIPLLNFILEGGYGLRIALICDSIIYASLKQKILNTIKTVGTKKNIEFVLLAEKEDLYSLLANNRIDCVLSNLDPDFRLLEHNLNSFSILSARRGYQGAISFWNTLKRKCGNKFLKDFKKFKLYNAKPIIIE